MANPPNTGVAPICNATAEQPSFFTKPPSFPRFAPPDFTNPQSVAQAILQLQQALIALTNQPPPNNTIPSLAVDGTGGAINKGGGGSGNSGKKTPTPNTEWQETDRESQNVKVVNPDDDSQFVIVKEIVFLEFTQNSTGEVIQFFRDPQ